jgi:hypothetical protein
MTDPIIQRIESFRCRRGQLVAERRNRGHAYRASAGTPIARVRPDRTIVSRCSTGRYGRNADQRRAVGRTILTIDDARGSSLQRTSLGRGITRRSKMRKVSEDQHCLCFHVHALVRCCSIVSLLVIEPT